MPDLARRVLAKLDREQKDGRLLVAPTQTYADAVAEMPLDRFARAGMIVEVDSAILGQRVWFVSGEAEVQRLLRQGIGRGNIYSAVELMSLLSLPGLNNEAVKSVHVAKRLFDGTVEPGA